MKISLFVFPFLFFSVFAYGQTPTPSLKKFKTSDLLHTRDILAQRIGVIDIFNKLYTGIEGHYGFPSGDVESKYLESSRAAENISPPPKDLPPECQHFYKTSSALRKDLRYNLSRYLSHKWNSSARFFEGRIISLSRLQEFLLEVAIAQHESDAFSLLEFTRVKCNFPDRENWLNAVKTETIDLGNLRTYLFGIPGFQDSHTRSTWMFDHVTSKATHDLHWMFPEMIGGLAVGMAAWYVALWTGGAAVAEGIMGARTAAVGQRVLFAGVGGYFGAAYGNSLVPIQDPIWDSKIDEKLTRIDYFLALPLETPMAYGVEVGAYEDAVSQANNQLLRTLVPKINEVAKKWGTLEGADKEFQKDLKLVDEELERRK